MIFTGRTDGTRGFSKGFFNENPYKNPKNIDLLDMVLELLHHRMLRLMDLNQAIEKSTYSLSGYFPN